MPEVREGALRVDFFFSFFGRMVSALGLARRLPLFPGPPGPVPTATWGMELTVSVSTVMFLTEPSPDGFPLPMADVVYALEGPLGRVGADVFPLPSLFPPLSLPLSLLVLALMVLLEALSATVSCSLSDFDTPFSPFSGTRLSPRAGVLGRLISCTVSSVEFVPLKPLAGDRVPDTGVASSPSTSEAACLPSVWSVGGGDRRALIDALGSALRGETTLGLPTGGGDRSRGDIGQRGGSLGSAVVGGFWGVGALRVGSDETGGREGVVAADSMRCWAAVEGGLLGVVAGARDGLTSL